MRKSTPTLRAWRTPPSPGPWIALPALAVGLAVAALLPSAPRPGINVPLSGLVLGLPLVLLLHREGRRRELRRPIGRAAWVLIALAFTLSAVSAVRATAWLSIACALAGLLLLLAVMLDLRRWNALLFGPEVLLVAVVRSLRWATRDLHRGHRPVVHESVAAGLGIGVALMIGVGALLASADAAYAHVLSVLVPDLDRMPLRAAVFVLAGLVFLGGAFAACSRLRWQGVPSGPAGPAAQWLIPLVLVAATIATFLAVEAGTLFGGLEVVVRSGSSLTHAARARQGFGQLCAVTVLVLILLAWAGSLAGRVQGEAARRDRRWMGLAGGTLLVLTVLLAASALRRLSLYQAEYGWTVARLNAGSFEIWLLAVLLAATAVWLLRRVDLLPRLVIGSAGAGLLVVSMLSPDALVARLDVDRYLSTGKIDTGYLALLSDDAVPALQRLPDPLRGCVLSGRSDDADPVLGWNWSRSRATRLLDERPAPPPVATPCDRAGR